MTGPAVMFLVAPAGAKQLYRSVLDGLPHVQAEPVDLQLLTTSSPSGEWTIAAEVAQLEARIDAITLGPIHLTGYSGGGAVALAYAATNIHRLASLTIVEPPWIGAGLVDDRRDGDRRISVVEVVCWHRLLLRVGSASRRSQVWTPAGSRTHR